MQISIAEAIWPETKVKPLQICLSELVGHSKDSGQDKADATFDKGKSTATGKKHDRGNRAKGPLSCSSRNNRGSGETEALDTMKAQQFSQEGERKFEDAIMADSNVHKKLGLWAIDSVNGNSWSGGSKYLEFSGADIVLFQETKLKEDDAIKSAEGTAMRLGWKLSMSRAANGERGGASAGVGVTIRKQLGMAHPDVEVESDVESRFSLKKLGAIWHLVVTEQK